MTERAKLIERLEKAEAGSRELDALVAVASGLATEINPKNPERVRYIGEHSDFYLAATPVTRSLDAAVALVERLKPGQEWSIGSNQPDIGEPWARIRTAPLRSLEESAATPALALCLALLKALEARDG